MANRPAPFLSAVFGCALAASTLPSNAEQDLPMPSPALPAPFQPAPQRGEMLRIPGLPPVELPPGAHVFGPRGAEISPLPQRTRPSMRGESPDASPAPYGDSDAIDPSARGKAAKPAPDKPAPEMSAEAKRAHVLDELFKRLADTDNPQDAKIVADSIQRVWLHSGSDTADLLMTRALAAISAKDFPLSIEILDHVVELAPNWAEAWNKRATARFLADDYDGSMADIDRTLSLEPRHFGALGGLATILQRSGNDKRALEVLRRELQVYPQQEEIKKLIDRLAPDIDGRDI